MYILLPLLCSMSLLFSLLLLLSQSCFPNFGQGPFLQNCWKKPCDSHLLNTVAELVEHLTGIKWLLVLDSPESLCCFLEQDTVKPVLSGHLKKDKMKI